ncbi:MAG: SCP2 sterol-binding domain-containing protein [Gammaproteobacteria bacterium]|nr:SCP2 sterol-binding domain-containing protein [Gammaproteobacteria bacterium]MCL5255635.1 SCP2 sterol-binding domain-containing protein [Gammaproteobacteria bacterium]
MQVLRASAERTLNLGLANDPGAKQRLQPLHGKCFRLIAKGLPESITILFLSDRVHLMGPDYEVVDCAVTTTLSDLPKLSDTNNVTKMLQTGQIEIVGDPVLAQQAAQVFLQLNVDWEEFVAGYFGDVPGYLAGQVMKKLAALRPEKGAIQTRAQAILTEELRVAVHPLEKALVADDLRDLERKIKQLEARIGAREQA